jgi:hypothetical protein
MRDAPGVEVKATFLPLSSTPIYLPPFWLRPGEVLVRG